MGRHRKIVRNEDGLDRRQTGFYRTPAFVADFVAATVAELNPQAASVFDPCIGDGAFVRPFLKRGYMVSGIDVLEFPLPDGIYFQKTDFLDLYRLRKQSTMNEGTQPLPQDVVVLNPPYNCHENDYIRSHKDLLSSLFTDVGVLNMYSLFITAIIELVKPGTIIGILTLDSFFTAKAHAALRRKILSNCALHYLLLAPTDLFLSQGADVRTCLMILQKGREHQHEVCVLNRPHSTDDFKLSLEQGQFPCANISNIVLSGEQDNNEFIVGVPGEIRSLLEEERLGERFRCFTGISTGSDRHYLRPTPESGHSVPFYKNPGRRKFFCEPDAYLPDNYIDIAGAVPNFIVRNKGHLTREGVICSSMGVAFSACFRPSGSTFGVNANIYAPQDCWWLIGYLNSSLVTYLVRGVLNRSNMITSGYVSRIPLAPLSPAAKRNIASVAMAAYHRQVGPEDAQECVAKIDEMVWADLGIRASTTEQIFCFKQELLRAT